jgi:hypothetical protein
VHELIKTVAQRTGLGEDKARMAAEAVLGFLKERLPAPIASQLDSVVGDAGSPGASNMAGDVMKNAKGGLGGMFGGGNA